MANSIQVPINHLSVKDNLRTLVPGFVLVTAFLLRMLPIFFGNGILKNVWSDMEMYLRISEEINSGHWHPTHFFQSIGYPLLIGLVKKSSEDFALSLSFLQALTSTLTLYFIFKLVYASFGYKSALASLIVGCLHLPWIFFPSFALPEVFFTFLLSLCAWMTHRICQNENTSGASFIWGASFILAFWLKGTHALWGPLFFLGLIYLQGRGCLNNLLIIGATVSIGLGLHGYLTFSKIGKIQLSASTGGLNFVEGKCPSKKNTDSHGYTWQSPLYFQLDNNLTKTWNMPFTDSGYFFKQGLQCISRDPYVLIQSLESIPYLFYGNHMWPLNRKEYSRYSRLYDLFFAFFSVVGLTGYWLSFRRVKFSKSELVIWTVPIISLFLCVYIFKSELRYRAPFDIWIIPLSVLGWSLLLRKEGYLSLKSESR
jgi:hypothetical protein